jgi:hypothetical protein
MDEIDHINQAEQTLFKASPFSAFEGVPSAQGLKNLQAKLILFGIGILDTINLVTTAIEAEKQKVSLRHSTTAL